MTNNHFQMEYDKNYEVGHFLKIPFWTFFGWLIETKKLMQFKIRNRLHSLWKEGVFAIGLATQFLSCITHLQLTVFICCECYLTSCKSCKNCNSPYIQCNSLQLNYNFVTRTPFQLLCNSPMITIIMSWWCHFSSIHQNLTCGTMKFFHDFLIFCDFFKYWYPSSIMIICFRWSWIMTHGIVKSCHVTY